MDTTKLSLKALLAHGHCRRDFTQKPKSLLHNYFQRNNGGVVEIYSQLFNFHSLNITTTSK